MFFKSGLLQVICLYVTVGHGLELSKSRVRRQVSGACVLPEYPAFGYWSVYFNPSGFKPGMLINEGTVLLINCEDGYTLKGSATTSCDGGNWIPAMGNCLETARNITNYYGTTNTTESSTQANGTGCFGNDSPSCKDVKGCVLPEYPSHGKWSVPGGSNLSPGMRVPPSTILQISCDKQYEVNGSLLIYCVDTDQWSYPLGKCARTCPSIYSTLSTKVTCTYEGKETENCTAAVQGAIARYQCAPFYENLELAKSPHSFCADGTWSRPYLECTPECGKRPLDPQPLIIGGSIRKKETYPWHVAVYRIKEKQFLCGGSMISQRVILTVAHCVTDFKGKEFPKEEFIVGVGKHYQKFDDVRDANSAQFSTLQGIYISKQYRGEVQNYLGDIAVLVTTKTLKISRNVQPVCVDWSSNYKVLSGDIGHFVGWGFTSAGRPSEELKELAVPVVEFAECFEQAPENFKRFLTHDKFCAGHINKSASICAGDSGGGLVVKRENRYYITGIASVAPRATDGDGRCNSQTFAAYTSVDKYIPDLILKHSQPAKNTTSNEDSGRCLLPVHPNNGRWVVGSNSLLEPGDFVPPGATIAVSCSTSYILDGLNSVECRNGKWNSSIGNCLAPCPPISNTRSLQVSCSSGSAVANCTNATHGTVAIFKCQPFYENPHLDRNPFRVCENGQWTPEIPSCAPVCGTSSDPSEEENQSYPWNVAIYRVDGKVKNFICAGTLINEKIILTSAKCISDEFATKFSPAQYTVAAGISSANASVNDEVQHSDLEDIFIPKDYKGYLRRYWADIAILVTKKPFTLTDRVQLACLDWDQKYSSEFEFPNIKGSIPSPLFSNSEKQIDVPFVDDTKCYSQLSATLSLNDSSSYYTIDKICSGYINSNQVPKCELDRGVGLVSRNRYDNKYYLTGIASIFPSVNPEKCDNQRWVLFTLISKHMSGFILEKNKLYTPVSSPYFQSYCGVKSVHAETLIVGGNNVTRSDYPWQVAIYRIEQTKKKLLICGGSLINQRIILTAAHCVTDANGNLLPKEIFIAAVGKYFRDFNHPEDKEVQFSSILEIFTSPQYQGELQNYMGDVALLVSEKSFVLSRNIQPVCVDWENKYEAHLLKPSVTGFVAGWGWVQKNKSPSQVLKDLEVEYVERNECKEKIPSDYNIFLTFDKLCSGFLNKSKGVCKGDSGGGLVFKNEIDDRYYVLAIVSLSPKAPSGGCDTDQYALYTKVSHYLRDFILKKAQQYWR